MPLPGINTLYSILRRDIELSNNHLEQRVKLASDLHANAQKWIEVLMTTFNEAIAAQKSGDNQEARKIMEAQIWDFMKLDYWSLKKNSPILIHLKEDRRFRVFVYACVNFYDSALQIKQLVYGGIEDADGNYLNAQTSPIEDVTSLYRENLEDMLSSITRAFHEVQTIQNS
jgi:hypothetical protein